MNGKQRFVVRALFTVGVLISMATFLLGAVPVKWGLFLSAACFVVGSMFWCDWLPEWRGGREGDDRGDLQ